ncbi:MAG: hypothetical protein ACI835_003376 [Planctomycetota bacterium]|jgi:hypothetical protein
MRRDARRLAEVLSTRGVNGWPVFVRLKRSWWEQASGEGSVRLAQRPRPKHGRSDGCKSLHRSSLVGDRVLGHHVFDVFSRDRSCGCCV